MNLVNVMLIVLSFLMVIGFIRSNPKDVKEQVLWYIGMFLAWFTIFTAIHNLLQ